MSCRDAKVDVQSSQLAGQVLKRRYHDGCSASEMSRQVTALGITRAAARRICEPVDECSKRRPGPEQIRTCLHRVVEDVLEQHAFARCCQPEKRTGVICVVGRSRPEVL